MRDLKFQEIQAVMPRESGGIQYPTDLKFSEFRDYWIARSHG